MPAFAKRGRGRVVPSVMAERLNCDHIGDFPGALRVDGCAPEADVSSDRHNSRTDAQTDLPRPAARTAVQEAHRGVSLGLLF